MTSSAPSGSAVTTTDSNDKTVAIVGYLTLIGFIVAIILHSSKKNALGSFHLRQSLGLMIASIALMFVGSVIAFVPHLGWILGMALWCGLLVLWFMGFLAAVNGQMKPVPVVGEYFSKWFSGAFA